MLVFMGAIGAILVAKIFEGLIPVWAVILISLFAFGLFCMLQYQLGKEN